MACTIERPPPVVGQSFFLTSLKFRTCLKVYYAYRL